MPIQLTTPTGQAIHIEDNPLASGGEGAVFRIIQPSPAAFLGCCVKMYFPQYQTPEREQKARFMAHQPPALPATNTGDFIICWPKELVYQNGRFVGFIMPLAFSGSIELYELTTLQIRNTLSQAWHQKYDRTTMIGVESRCKLCVNIALAVHLIHQMGRYCLVDFKPQNVLVTDDGRVSLIDLDSVQIAENSVVRFPAKVATAEYSPAEAPRLQNRYIPETWDRFSLAVVFYEILFGLHPYAASFKPPYDKVTTISDAIQNSLFVLGPNQHHVHKRPPYHDNFLTLPDNIKWLFFKALVDGSQRPDYRPAAADWGQTIFSELSNPQRLITWVSQSVANTQTFKTRQTARKTGSHTPPSGTPIFPNTPPSPVTPHPPAPTPPYPNNTGTYSSPNHGTQPQPQPVYNQTGGYQQPQPVYNQTGGYQQPQPQPSPYPASSPSNTVKYVAVVGILLAVLGVAYYVYNYIVNPGKQIIAKIGQNRIVTPTGDSAYDLYMQYKDRLPENIKAEIKSKVKPELERSGDALISKMKAAAAKTIPEWEDGLKTYTWLQELEPSSKNEARKWFCEGYIARLKDDHTTALSSFQRADQKEPNTSWIYNAIGMTYYKKNNKQAALSWYRKAIQAEQKWVMPHMNFGQLNNELKNYIAARDAMITVLKEVEPGKASAFRVLGNAFTGLENHCDAAKYYQEALNRGVGDTDDDPAETKRRVERGVEEATKKCASSMSTPPPTSPF